MSLALLAVAATFLFAKSALTIRPRTKLFIFAGAGHSAEDSGSCLELPELFCSLGSLIVEGRLPASGARGSGRGYTEGPHVELPGRISRHKCSQTEYLVS